MTERQYGWRQLNGRYGREWSMISDPPENEEVEWLEVVSINELGPLDPFFRDVGDTTEWIRYGGPILLEGFRKGERHDDNVYLLTPLRGGQIVVATIGREKDIKVYVRPTKNGIPIKGDPR